MDARERFQRWQQAVLAAPATGEKLSYGPFVGLVAGAGEPAYEGWVTVTGGHGAAAAEALNALRCRLVELGATLEIEYDEEAYPGIAAVLSQGGLVLRRRDPLMGCFSGEFRPSTSPDVEVRPLTVGDPDSDLEAFQVIRWTNGGDREHDHPPVERLRREIEKPGSTYLLATSGGEPVGTGVSHVLGQTAEIVGVVTRSDMRRRGIAATVTSLLLERHFASGGDYAFLDAANETAARLYERLGFFRFGMLAVWEAVT